jgi:hypothetical protein
VRRAFLRPWATMQPVTPTHACKRRSEVGVTPVAGFSRLLTRSDDEDMQVVLDASSCGRRHVVQAYRVGLGWSYP